VVFIVIFVYAMLTYGSVILCGLNKSTSRAMRKSFC